MSLLSQLAFFVVFIGVLASWLYRTNIQESLHYAETVRIGPYLVHLSRLSPTGTVRILAENDCALSAGLGYAHAKDRLTSLMITRLAAQGRLSECLAENNFTIAVDTLMRSLSFLEAAKTKIKTLTTNEFTNLQAYSLGINTWLQKNSGSLARPFELLLVGYDPEPFKIEDSLIIGSLMSYLGLAQTHHTIEKMIFDWIRNGVSLQVLKDIFSPHLDSFPPHLIDLYKRVKAPDGSTSQFVQELKSLVGGGGGGGSNNWAISGNFTTSGFPLFASDPHLEIHRLPPIWYQAALFVYNVSTNNTENKYAAKNIEKKLTDNDTPYRFGITLPGVPGILMGRNNHLSFSLTYGFMDQIDLFIVEVNNGKYLAKKGDKQKGENDVWEDLIVQNEQLRLKSGSMLNLRFYRTPYGVLETEPRDLNPISNGFYLLVSFALTYSNTNYTIPNGFPQQNQPLGEASLRFFHDLQSARTVAEGQAAVKDLMTSSNYIFADNSGNIGYQQTGILPNRPGNVPLLYPVESWFPQNLWNGIVSTNFLNAYQNPEQGFVVTANDGDVQMAGGVQTLNVHFGPNRKQRIVQLITEKLKRNKDGKLTVDDMKSIQCDVQSVLSKQAMVYIRPIVEDLLVSSAGNLTTRQELALKYLLHWDFNFNTDSAGALVFFELIERVFREGFGQHVLGRVAEWDSLNSKAKLGLFKHIYGIYFLSERITPSERNDIINTAVRTLLDEIFADELIDTSKDQKASSTEEGIGGIGVRVGSGKKTYRHVRKLYLLNVFFSGKLPNWLKWLGFDYGPIYVPGFWDTPNAGNIVQLDERVVTFFPSWRYITDLSTHEVLTALPGGPSGRRFSGLYQTGVDGWLSCQYQKYVAQPN